MVIVLMRHGVAEDSGDDKPEEQRGLTTDSSRKIEHMARFVSGKIRKAHAIYSSPFARACETARRVAEAHDGNPTIHVTPALAPGRTLAELYDHVQRNDVGGAAYYIGHEPQLTALMLELTNMRADGALALAEGACYGLEVNGSEQSAKLLWKLSPNMRT